MTISKRKHQQQLQLHFRRFEIKYLVTPTVKYQIRNCLERWLQPDLFAGEEGNYLVTSIYFDSPGRRFYYENEAGLKDRQKFRHRYYNQDQSQLFWEVKSKTDSIIVKDRCLATQPSPEVAHYFDSCGRLWRLRPMVWVRYLRESWVGQNDVRVTFDRNLIIGRPPDVGIDRPRLVRSIFPGWEVLEFKYPGRLPRWLSRIIYKFGLQRQAIGKYRLAIESLNMLY